MPNRSTVWAAVFLAATFAAGIAVGAGARALWVRRAAAASPDRAHGIDHMMSELNEELKLTPAQSDTVRAVLQRHWTKMSAVWEAVRPRFDTLRAEMDAEVSRHLTADQQAKYRDHVTRYRRQRDRERTDSSGRKP